MLKKILLGCGLPLLLVVLIAGYAARTLFKKAPEPQRSETAQVGDVEIKVVETGQIEPLRKVEVKSKAGGRLLRLFVEEGAIVRQGQIMATIDPQEVNSQVAALRAQLAAAQARLASARTNVGYQQATTTTGIDQYTHNLAAAKARLDSAEAESKVQPMLTSQSIEIAQSNLDAARAQLKAQQDSLDLMVQSTHPNNVVAAQAVYDQARANYENAVRNIDRQKKLNAKGFVSQQVVDSAQVDADVAGSRVTEAKTRLDRMPQTQNLEIANARSQVAAAQGQVRQMEATLAQARSNILPATKRNDLESARAAYAQAKAQLEQARAGRAQDTMRGSDAQASAAEVQQIQQQLNERLVGQQDTTLYAPMTGMVTRRYAEVGDLIASAIASFSSGTPVYQVADTATMLVKLNVNEVDIGKIRVGLPTEVTIDASKGATYKGHVRKVSPASVADSTGTSAASTGQTVIRFPVEIQIDPTSTNAPLRPGMSARCAIIVARQRKTLRLPVNCVQGTGSKGSVQVVKSTQKDGKPVETTTPRDVTVGVRGDDFIEILSGLHEGEKVRPNPFSGPKRKEIDIKMGD
jgi:HlyD family secretion protein